MRIPAGLLALLLAAAAPIHAGEVADWPVTEGAPGGGRYSPLADITRENVAQLRVAWTLPPRRLLGGHASRCA